MAFNINNFVSTLNKYDGISRNAFFEVVIHGANRYGAVSNDLKFFCKSVTAPGLNVNSLSYRPNNIEMPQSMPMFMNRDEVDCVFMMDGKHEVLKFFHNWMRDIVNFNTTDINFLNADGEVIDVFDQTTAADETNRQQLSYELNYKSEYAKEMTITHFAGSPDSSGYNRKYVYRLTEAFPTQVSPVTLTWEENNSVSTLPVNFSYSSIEMIQEIGGIRQQYLDYN